MPLTNCFRTCVSSVQRGQDVWDYFHVGVIGYQAEADVTVIPKGL